MIFKTQKDSCLRVEIALLDVLEVFIASVCVRETVKHLVNNSCPFHDFLLGFVTLMTPDVFQSCVIAVKG